MKTVEEIYNENGFDIEQLSKDFNTDAFYLYDLGKRQKLKGQQCDLKEVDKILATWETQYWTLNPFVSNILKQCYEAAFEN